MKYVKVVWDDASSNLHEEGEDDVKYDECLTESVGILALQTEEGIVLFTDYVPSMNEYRCKHNIPKGMIKSITYLL